MIIIHCQCLYYENSQRPVGPSCVVCCENIEKKHFLAPDGLAEPNAEQRAKDVLDWATAGVTAAAVVALSLGGCRKYCQWSEGFWPAKLQQTEGKWQEEAVGT